MTFEVIFGLGYSTASWPWCVIVPCQIMHACRRYQNGSHLTSLTLLMFRLPLQGHARRCELSFL